MLGMDLVIFNISSSRYHSWINPDVMWFFGFSLNLRIHFFAIAHKFSKWLSKIGERGGSHANDIVDTELFHCPFAFMTEHCRVETLHLDQDTTAEVAAQHDFLWFLRHTILYSKMIPLKGETRPNDCFGEMPPCQGMMFRRTRKSTDNSDKLRTVFSQFSNNFVTPDCLRPLILSPMYRYFSAHW